jgi:Flp pilus assembly protein TadG
VTSGLSLDPAPWEGRLRWEHRKLKRTMVAGRGSRPRDQKGAAAVEFALVVPLLLLLVFGVISYGYMLSFRQALSQGAAEGARAAAVSPYPDSGDKEQAALDAINDALGVDAYGISCSGAAVGSALEKDGVDVGTCSVTTASCAQDPTKDCVTVDLDYRYRDHPLLPNFPGVGLLLPSHLRYDSTARVS